MLIKSLLFIFLFLFLFYANGESSENMHIQISDENFFKEDVGVLKKNKNILTYKPPSDDIEWSSIKEKLTNELIANFRKDVSKKYKKRIGIELLIFNANIFFHSIDSYYFESFDYKITEKGLDIISGSFSQTRDCNKQNSFYKSVCGIPEISRFLLVKIQKIQKSK